MIENLLSSNINHDDKNHIIFIDSQVNNYQDLVSGVGTSEVVILEPGSNGIDEITNVLSQHEDIHSVQIISHGNSDYLQIGGTDLSLDNLDNYQSQLQQWSEYLHEDADILLFGCQVGSNAELIKSISEMTQADVAASVDYTGNDGQNGEWHLEVALGEIESELAIDDVALESYESILAVPEAELFLELEDNENLDAVVVSNVNTNAIQTNAYISQDWNNGYKLEVDLTAETNAEDWQLDFDFSQSIRAVFGVNLINNGGGSYSIKGINSQAGLTPGQSVKAIFIIDGNTNEASIPDFTISGSGISDELVSARATNDIIETNTYISQDWNNGYKLEVDLTAATNAEDWQLDFDFSQSIRAVYGVNLINNGGGNYSIKGINGQAGLTSGQSVKAIFIIDGNTNEASIPDFTISGTSTSNTPKSSEESMIVDAPTNVETPPPVFNNVFSPQKFTANNSLFNYDGRIDWSDPQAPALGNPGTSVEFKFTGTMLQIELLEDRWGGDNYVDVYLDDNPEPITIKLRREGGNPITYNIANNLENKVHNAVIYKRNDYITGEFEFHSITIDGQLLTPNPDSKRTIEIYGDSISSGIAVEYPITGVSDPRGNVNNISNAYHTYGSILARDFDAEVSLVAQGGVPLVNGFGFWNNFWNGGVGAEAIYDKVKPLHDAPTWDFNNYAADLVIVAYGQNDSSTIGNNLSAQQWKDRYKQLIANLRAKHPEAYFVGMFPNMFHNPQWDNYIIEAINEYRQEYNDDKVFSLINQQVTSGHPRISEQQQMADTLKNFIDGTLSANGFHWNLAD